MLQSKVLEHNLYIAGLVFAAVSFAGIIFAISAPFDVSSIIPPCTFKSVTGLYCPGCGGTRAVISFVTGHWLKSFMYNSFVPYCGILYILFMAKGTRAFISKGKYQYMKFRDIYVFCGIAILLIQFVARNIMLLVYGKDLLAGH
ncbi:MAG: DUF2752 domain-containing protein [Lachnospiraceae bacterium]